MVCLKVWLQAALWLKASAQLHIRAPQCSPGPQPAGPPGPSAGGAQPWALYMLSFYFKIWAKNYKLIIIIQTHLST